MTSRSGRTRLPTMSVRVAVAGLLLAGGVTVGLADGPSARSVALEDGSAWLVSSAVGQAVLIDGASAQVVTQVEVGRGTLSAAQSKTDVFVANSSVGSVVRIDGATFAKSGTARFAQPDQPLSVFPGGHAVYTVNETTGIVTIADPETLGVRGTESLGARVRSGAALVDGDGRLWLVDGDSGDLVRLDAGGKHIRPRAVDPAQSTLVLAGSRVVVVDLAAREVRPVGTDGIPGAATCLDTRRGDGTVTVTGSPSTERVYAASGSRGVLLVSDLARRTCTGMSLGVTRHQLGPTREVAGRLFVPDYTSGQVHVVDLARRAVLVSPKVLPADTPFELVPSGSFVFFNDPVSARAGVVRLDGTSTEVRKYNPDRPGAGVVQDASGGGPSSGPTPTTAKPTAAKPTTPPTSSPSGPPTTEHGNVQIALSATTVAAEDPVTMRVTATGGGRLSAVRWQFGDGAEGSGVEARHAWTKPGEYTVSAQVTLSDGRRAVPTAKVTVVGAAQPPPNNNDVGPSRTP
ncbi:PKD domain-containing protein, partial [Frankia gtarii]